MTLLGCVTGPEPHQTPEITGVAEDFLRDLWNRSPKVGHTWFLSLKILEAIISDDSLSLSFFLFGLIADPF